MSGDIHEKRFFEDLTIGMQASLERTIKAADVEAFADLTGDHNPVHLDPEFAAKTPFKKCIAHGLLSSSLIGSVLGTRLPGAGAVYMKQDLKFLSPVFVGETITATVTITAMDEQRAHAELSTDVAVGDRAVLSGHALLKIPRRS